MRCSTRSRGSVVGKRKATAPAPVAPEFPYALNDAASIMGGKFGRLWVVGTTFCGVRVVYRHPNIDTQLGVRDRVIYDWKLKLYQRQDLEESALQSLWEELKSEMLEHGASPLAVQWVGELSPFSAEEYKEMAGKLTKKEAPKASTKAAKAPAAAKAPKAAKEPKAPDNRKIKVLNKDHGARAGSKTADRYNAIIAAKTVQEALDNTAEPIKMADINYAVGKGIISLG